jgi:hypothetical protein
MQCPPSYDILCFVEPTVEHSFMAHDLECIVLSMVCLGGRGGVTRHISISGYLHLRDIDSEICYVRFSSSSVYKPQGISKSVQNSYANCVVSSGIWSSLTAVLLKVQFFWDLTPCPWTISSRRFEGWQCLHLQTQVVKVFAVMSQSWWLNFCNYMK